MLGMVATCAGASNRDHSFSVKDDIAMVRFSEPFPESGVLGSDIALRSPDGKYFAVVTCRGLLKSDQIESQVMIVSQDRLRAFMQSTPSSSQSFTPRVVATIVGTIRYSGVYPYATVIEDLRWSTDMKSIYFKGEGPSGAYQIYEAKIDGSGFRALTSPKWSVDRYDVQKDTIAYTASLPDSGSIDQGVPINRDAWMVTGFSLEGILFPGQLSTVAPETFSVWVIKESHGEWKTTRMPTISFRDERNLSFLTRFKLSPQNDRLIYLTPVTKVPALWQSYDPAAGFEHLRLRNSDPELTQDNNIDKPQQYSLIDLLKGKSIPLVNAPNAMSLAYVEKNSVAWAPDERRALVTNTFLPLDQGSISARSEHTKPCAVASVDIPSLHVDCLLGDEGQIRTGGMRESHSGGVLDVAFGSDDNEVLVLVNRGSSKRTLETYRIDGDAWKFSNSLPVNSTAETLAEATTRYRTGTKDVQLVVKQGLNDPPTLWAQDERTGAQRQIWDPNPQFAHIEFGSVSVYRWNDKTGHEWSGGLVKPVGYVPGRRYPLVIQMYKFHEDQFMTDGTDPSAFAARELASAGVMVLQVEKYPNTLSYVDPEMALNGYRSAVEHLSEAGLIDPSRVGAVGFSASCWLVETALVSAPHLFAAATIADGIDNSYMEYHFVDLALREQMEKTNGAKPSGEGLKTWFGVAVGFHLDKVQTPVRIEAINPLSLLCEWELYSSLRVQNKPVDLIYFPQGTHIHQRPLERLESQQGDIDWMRFWLQTYEDPDPAKRSQYLRWEKLRELRIVDEEAVGTPAAGLPTPN
jgi:dipeptidyl aminopeptidase/acylaminoacyl peptidase